MAANVMFGLAAVSISQKSPATPAHSLTEMIAPLGPILVIFALPRPGGLTTRGKPTSRAKPATAAAESASR